MQYTLGNIIRKSRPTVSVLKPLPNTLHKNASGVVVETYASGGDILTSETTGSIVYTNRSKRYPKRSNLCVHKQTQLRMIPESPTLIVAQDLNPAHPGWTWEPWWDYGTSYAAHLAAKTAALAELGAVGVTKLQANWTSYAVRGFESLQPDLTKLSLPNFMIELKDIGKLADEISPFLRAATGASGKTQLLVDFNRFRDLAGKDQFKTAAKLAAEKRLSYKFGWNPTIGDVQAMFDSIINLDLRLQAFKNSIGKDLSYTKTVEKTDVWKTGTFLLNGDSHYRVNWAGYLNGKVQYHAKYTPQPLAVLGPLDEKIRGVLDHFGVELNPRILWDAIPFTFVLDWFTGFGAWLGQYKVDALELPILLSDSAVSYKETYQVNSAVIINPNGYPTDVTSTTKPGSYSMESKFFHRMPLDPSIASFRQLGWRNPTGSQWTNFVSLATVLGL
jgi:hypothetical protein